MMAHNLGYSSKTVMGIVPAGKEKQPVLDYHRQQLGIHGRIRPARV
jgi:hypothetical protein